MKITRITKKRGARRTISHGQGTAVYDTRSDEFLMAAETSSGDRVEVRLGRHEFLQLWESVPASLVITYCGLEKARDLLQLIKEFCK